MHATAGQSGPLSGNFTTTLCDPDWGLMPVGTSPDASPGHAITSTRTQRAMQLLGFRAADLGGASIAPNEQNSAGCPDSLQIKGPGDPNPAVSNPVVTGL